MFKKESYKIKEGYNKEEVIKILENFNNEGTMVFNGERNKIKKVSIKKKNYEKELNIKQFKKKGFFIKLFYKINKKGSKAKRSYDYAIKLLEKGIKTPEPIAYFDEIYMKEEGENRSFYISENINYDFTCREVFWNEKVEKKLELELEKNKDKIIRGFAEYTFKLHENGVKFDDYSPGNILIKKEKNGDYSYYLIDLNRMSFFDKLSFKVRMKNVSRMMEDKAYVEKFSKEYSKLYKEKSYDEIFEKMYYYVKLHNFKDKLHNIRRAIKRLLKSKK